MKSRSGGSQSSRSNSVESEDHQQHLHQQSSIQSLASSEGAIGECSSNEGTTVACITNTDSSVPTSPPPSYEHVLEETRLERSMADGEDTIEESAEENEMENHRDPKSTSERIVVKGPEILHKSSKEFYKAFAKQWGITCKMSDHCRCLDCQSRYFDCDYEKYEQEHTDGGLGAGSPVFISGVIHGTTCLLL